MKIHKGDKVKIIAGKDKGKEGMVLRAFENDQTVLVEGANKVKRHIKPGKVSKEGGILSIEKPINISNVMLIDPKTQKPVKLGFKIVDGKKYRISKESGEVINLDAKKVKTS